jgi:hypothetical protein
MIYLIIIVSLLFNVRKVFSIQRLQGICDKSVVFSETPVSSTNKTEIFLKVAVNTIKLKHG